MKIYFTEALARESPLLFCTAYLGYRITGLRLANGLPGWVTGFLFPISGTMANRRTQKCSTTWP